MALLIELFFFGVLPIAFALWQLHDVRKERAKRQREIRDEEGQD